MDSMNMAQGFNAPYQPDIQYEQRKPGHPYELTREDHTNIVNAYKETIVLSNVAGLCGRHEQTIKRWLEQGSEDILEGKNTIFSQFYTDVKKALGVFKVKYEKLLLLGGDGWQAIAWYLERCARKDYGRDNDLIAEIYEDFKKIKAIQEKKDD